MWLEWSIHKNGQWQGQMERMHRWHDRVQRACAAGSPDVEDFVFAFFQNCFTLREWVEKTSPLSKTDLDTFMESTPEMRICRDICNGTKHYSISRPSIDAQFSILREYNPYEPSRYRLFILLEDMDHVVKGKHDKYNIVKYDMVELAINCLRAWDVFLAPHIISETR